MKLSTICLVALFLFVPQAALSYIGPGGGLSALGALFALVLAVVVAIFGFVWYPIKRLLSSKNDLELDEDTEGDDANLAAKEDSL